MSRFVFVIALVLGACAHEEKSGYDPEILGRWDVTVQGEDSYPLWFEIAKTEGGLKGRLQGRFGHALDLESVEATGNHLTMKVDETTYHANLDSSMWKGTGEGKDGTKFQWVAERAPELPARAEITWGEPIPLFNGVDLAGTLGANPAVNLQRAGSVPLLSCQGGIKSDSSTVRLTINRYNIEGTDQFWWHTCPHPS